MLLEWLESVYDKIKDNPIQNLFILLVALIIIYVMGVALFEAFGIITAIGYVFACIYGLAKIIDKLERAIVWAVGYIIGALILPIALESIVPIMKRADWSSLIAIVVIVFVLLMLYLRARELKNY